MKKCSRFILTAVLALMMTAAFAMPQQASAVSETAKKPKATNVKYITENGKAKAIKSFTISPFTYANLSQDSVINPNGDSTMKLDDATLLRIAKRQIFPKWSIIAEGIFRDQANQLITIEGSGMMSSSTTASNSFDRHFSTGKVSNGYSADWAVSDLAALLAQEKSSHKGKQCWDETRVTGPTQIGSLNDARTLMGQELRNCSDDNDVSKDEFLGNSYQKNENKRRLPALEDEKSGDGFANIVTCVNRAGASGDYDYVTFGLAVYGFDITPVAAENLKYIEAADDSYEVEGENKSGKDILMGLAGNNVNLKGISFQNDTENGTTTYIRNNTTQEVTQSSGLENSITEENTIGTDDTFEWGMEQEIGLEINMGGFGGAIVDASIGFAAPCMFPRATFSMSNSWHELWSTTKSTSETKSATKTKTTNTEVTLPGHTIAVVNQSLENKKTTENYQQPVILNYKVAIFAMSGDYFNGASGGINNSRYDKQWMSVLFDGSDDSITSGCYALGSLYNRGVVNKDISGYDGAKGKYKSWCDKGAWNSSNKINWNDISSTLSGDSRSSHRVELSTGQKATTVKDLATELPLLEKAQILTSRRESTTSSVDQIVALYPLDSVSMESGSKRYELVPRGQQSSGGDDVLHLDPIEVKGYDKDGADFFEFDPAWGKWELLDSEGTVIKDGSAKDESNEEGVVQSGLVKLITNNRLDSQRIEVARSDGEAAEESHYIQWKLKKGTDEDGAKIVSNESLNRSPEDGGAYMTDAEKDEVSTPSIEIVVKDRESDIVNIEAKGSYKGPWDQEINLGHVFSADPVDQSGRISGVPVFWEAKENSDKLVVNSNGKTTFKAKGTYHVRPYSYDSADKKIIPKDPDGNPIWLEIIAHEKLHLDSIVLSQPELDVEDMTLTKDKTSIGFDLSSYTKFYDQNGDKWEGTEENPLPKVKYSVIPSDYAEIDDEDILTVKRKGKYTIKAKAFDKNGNDINIDSNSITITVREEDRLDSIIFEEPAMSKNELTLNSKDDYITVSNLKGLLSYVDQNGNEWEGQKPRVTFSVSGVGNSAEIKGGNFYAYDPGTYTIEATAEGYNIEPITIVITEETGLVLKSEDPGKQYLYTSDDQVELELERYINATTTFGSKWKGDVPDLKFTLDSDVTNASIETKTVYENDEDYMGEDRYFFKTSVPGDYVVHVEPRKASAYSDYIDDIFIRVVKGKKIARIEFMNATDILGDSGAIVDSYTPSYPKIDLSKLIKYYDGFGEKIDPQKDHVRIPDCQFELIEDGNDAYDPEDYDLSNGILTTYAGDVYFVKASMNVTNYDPNSEGPKEDTILEAQGTVATYEADWVHDFGDWEIVEPTCQEDGYKVKRCKGGDDCLIDYLNGEEGCDYEIRVTLPATGHAWEEVFKDEEGHWCYHTKCEKCGEINKESIVNFGPGAEYRYYHRDENWMPTSPVFDVLAGCEEPGQFKMEENEEVSVKAVPPLGHKWSKDYKVVEEATCEHVGREAIVCERGLCRATREERIIPKTEHQPDEAGWHYDTDSAGNLEQETCEEYGWKVTECKECHKPQYKLIMPTGHDWDEGQVETEATCTEDGVKKFTCKNDPTHTKTEVIPATGHKLVKMDKEEATCVADGHEAYWMCSTCEELFSDEEAANRIDEPVVIPATGHSWDSGVVTRKPTAEAEGEKTFTCTKCGETKTEPIDNSAEKAAAEAAKKAEEAAKKAEEAAKKLAEAKEAAKAAIDEALNKIDTSKLTEEAKAAVAKAVEDAKAAIDTANNSEGVEAAKKAAEDAIETAKKAEEAAKKAEEAAKKAAEEAAKKAEEAAKKLAEAKEAAKEALDKIDTSKYSGKAKEIVEKAIERAKKAIDAAKTPEEAAKAQQAAESAAAEQKTDEQKAKEAADKKKKAENAKGSDGTAFGKGADAKAVEKAITSMKTDKDPKGTKIAPLLLQSKTQGKNSIKLTWKKVSGAKKYVVYGNACGKKNKMKKLATRATNNFNVKRISKKLKAKTYHKFMVVALDKNNKVVSTSKVIHVATKGNLKKAANPKKVVVKAKVNAKGKKLKKWTSVKAVAVKAKKTVALKSSITKAKKSKVKKHCAIRYQSSNTKVATVTAKGKIKGIKKGTAKIYVYAQNGIYKTIKVKVK